MCNSCSKVQAKYWRNKKTEILNSHNGRRFFHVHTYLKTNVSKLCHGQITNYLQKKTARLVHNKKRFAAVFHKGLITALLFRVIHFWNQSGALFSWCWCGKSLIESTFVSIKTSEVPSCSLPLSLDLRQQRLSLIELLISRILTRFHDIYRGFKLLKWKWTENVKRRNDKHTFKAVLQLGICGHRFFGQYGTKITSDFNWNWRKVC